MYTGTHAHRCTQMRTHNLQIRIFQQPAQFEHHYFPQGNISTGNWWQRAPKFIVKAARGAEFATPKYASLEILIILFRLILRNSTHTRSSQIQQKSLLVRLPPSPGPAFTIAAEGMGFSLHNDLSLVHCVFLVTSCNWPPHPSSSFFKDERRPNIFFRL